MKIDKEASRKLGITVMRSGKASPAEEKTKQSKKNVEYTAKKEAKAEEAAEEKSDFMRDE